MAKTICQQSGVAPSSANDGSTDSDGTTHDAPDGWRRQRFFNLGGISSLAIATTAIALAAVPYSWNAALPGSDEVRDPASMGDVAPVDAVRFSASLNTDSLAVGQEYFLDVVAEPNTNEGYSFADGLSPMPLLQMRFPDCLERIVSPRETRFATVENLQCADELVLENGRGRVRFKVVATPKHDDELMLNLVCYIKAGDKSSARLVRRPGRMPLHPGGQLSLAPVNDDAWSISPGLTVGEKALSFQLPDKDGRIVDFDDFVGKKNVLVIIYRCFW